MRPLGNEGVFGYCENCGIVYALKDRLNGTRGAGGPVILGAGVPGESTEMNRPKGVSPVEAKPHPQSPGAYWKCPDCDTEIRSENESDLGFAKREHIREYHPNRSTG